MFLFLCCPLIFQLTTSRRGRPCEFLDRIPDFYFNSRPHEEVAEFDTVISQFEAFQLTTSRRGRRNVHILGLGNIFQLTTSRRGRAILAQKAFYFALLFVIIAYIIFILHQYNSLFNSFFAKNSLFSGANLPGFFCVLAIRTSLSTSFFISICTLTL